MIEVLSADVPRDVQRVKLIAEELDNDNGRAVYTAIYDGVETASDLASKLQLSIQLVSYHIEKLMLGGLVEEREDDRWKSEKGRDIKHYVPSKAALLIVPSITSLRSEPEIKERFRSALSSVWKKIVPAFLIAILAFVAATDLSTAGLFAAYSSSVVSHGLSATLIEASLPWRGLNYYFAPPATTNLGQSTFPQGGGLATGLPPLIPLILVPDLIGIAAGISCGFLIFRWLTKD